MKNRLLLAKLYNGLRLINIHFSILLVGGIGLSLVFHSLSVSAQQIRPGTESSPKIIMIPLDEDFVIPIVVNPTASQSPPPSSGTSTYEPIATSVTREISYEYYAATGLRYKQHIEPNKGQSRLDTEYAYDAFGNVKKVTLSSAATGTAAITTRSEGPTYDNVGKFPTTYANALGQTETRGFNDEFGKQTAVTDIDQNSASAQYDEFGRKKLDVHVDGTQLKTEYFYCYSAGGSTPCPNFAAYMVQTTPLSASGSQIGPVAKVYFTGMDKEVKTETIGFDGASTIEVSTQYDGLGRVSGKSRPVYSGQTPQWISTYYDSLDRVVKTVQPDNSSVTMDYNGQTTTITNSLNQKRQETKDDLGRVTTIVDNAGKSMSLFYDGFDELLYTKDSVGNLVQSIYDVRGNKIKMYDPDMGVWSYEYDVLGNMTRRVDAKAQATTFAYDLRNRITSRAETDLVSTWTYDTCSKGVGRLCSATTDNTYSRVISYDGYGRESKTTTTIDAAYTSSVGYDAVTGRVATQTYPNGLSVSYKYTLLGYLSEVRNTATNALYWQANVMDAESHLLQETYGNGIVSQQVFDPKTGFVKNIYAGSGNSVQNLAFDYDTVGNVKFRSDSNQNLSENFYYEDGLNRLTRSVLTSGSAGTVQQTYGYDDIGNVKNRSNVGTYFYGAVNNKPHALSSVSLAAGGTITYQYDNNGNLGSEVQKDASGNIVASKGRSETFMSFNMPLKLLSASGASLTYLYGPEHQRSKVTNSTGTIIYLNPNQEGGLLYEKETKGNVVEQRDFITALGQVIAIVKQIDSTTSVSYLHRDNLGSMTTVTNESGTVVERLAYDPFGKRRFPGGSDDTGNTIAGTNTARGFTNHEHLDSLELIHMNGRVFDPVLGRFLSADPNVPEPADMQSYNRYSYVRNNPLTYTDMTGFWDGSGGCIPWCAAPDLGAPRELLISAATYYPKKDVAGGNGVMAKQENASQTSSSANTPSGLDSKGLPSALLDTGKGVWNSGVGLVEGIPNLIGGAIPGAPDYRPFMANYRAPYDTPAFGTIVEVLTGVGALKVLGEFGYLSNTQKASGGTAVLDSEVLRKEIGTITTRTTRSTTRLGGEAGEPGVKITYRNGTEFDMTATRVKQTELNPYVPGSTRPMKFEDALNKQGTKRAPTAEEIKWFNSIFK